MKGQMNVEHASLSEKIDALTVKMDLVLQQKGGASYGSEYESLHKLPATSERNLLAVEHDIEVDLKYREFLIDYLKKRCSTFLPGSAGKEQGASSFTRCVNDC
ncbi:uncharacterized protein LOC124159654 [Ischnura elegans]|uniref:uncharacterized protein LOC124159654 n=1 Tax=Ischnura elegans TaxID=197161 RepID=UPI001ED8B893|nr:uncharacterized protein LOC124159654 [Ischnura elegans]